ncbi:MAG: hypothetical protein ACK5Z5_06970 [Neisseriaceae bacterium]
MKFSIENKPFFVCIILSIISIKYFSAVLMLITLLIAAILAMDGFKKHAIYIAIQSIICGVFGLIMGNVVTGLSNKVDLLTAYPSLVSNPSVFTKLQTIFNTMRLTQVSFIILCILVNIIIIRFFGHRLQSAK